MPEQKIMKDRHKCDSIIKSMQKSAMEMESLLGSLFYEIGKLFIKIENKNKEKLWESSHRDTNHYYAQVTHVHI